MSSNIDDLQNYTTYDNNREYMYEGKRVRFNITRTLEGKVKLVFSLYSNEASDWITYRENINDTSGIDVLSKYHKENRDNTCNLVYNYNELDVDIMLMLMRLGIIHSEYTSEVHIKQGKELYRSISGSTTYYVFKIPYLLECKHEQEGVSEEVIQETTVKKTLVGEVAKVVKVDTKRKRVYNSLENEADNIRHLNVNYKKRFFYEHNAIDGYAPITDILEKTTKVGDEGVLTVKEQSEYELRGLVHKDKLTGLSDFRINLYEKETGLEINIGKSLLQFDAECAKRINTLRGTDDIEELNKQLLYRNTVRSLVSNPNIDGTRNIIIPNKILNYEMISVLFETCIIEKTPIYQLDVKVETGVTVGYGVYRMNYRLRDKV